MINHTHRTRSRKSSFWAPCAALLLATLIGASPVSPRVDARKAHDSFQAIQRQIDTVESRLIKSTVALQLGGVSGSGVIISPDGYILTAAHVIAGRHPRPCRVTLADGRRMQATVLGSNRHEDFGLIKIEDAKDLPTVPLGDSATLRPGEWVLATGHPLGLHAGRPPVLRLGRVLGGPRRNSMRQIHRILTDAPLISGDSGGPLFDLTGRVVGIHSMITEGDRWMASIHVPVNLAKAVMSQLEKGEEPTDEEVQDAPLSRALRDADNALQSGDNAAAIRAAENAIKLDDTSAMARVVLARAQARTGKTALALASLKEAADRGYNDTSSLRVDSDFGRLRGQEPFQQLLARLDALNVAPGNRKGDRSILDAATGAEPNVGRGVVGVFANGEQITLGTVMSADGDILTKASELPDGPLTCRMPDGSSLPAERKGVDSAWDVALLKVKATALPVLPAAPRADLGHWTFTPDASGNLTALGVVGVAEMPVYGIGIAPKRTSKAYMGAFLVPLRTDALHELGLESGVGLDVQADTPAARAGLKTGDILLEFEGKPVTDPDAVMDLMLRKSPGDSLALKVARDKDRITINVRLESRPHDIPGRGGLAEMLSGEVSHRAGPFPRVIHHDAVLAPNTMGGPLLDSDGSLIGMNIARADRTSTYAIPAKDLAEIYSRLKSAK